MGDWAAADLWSASHTQADGFSRCAGCGDPIEPDDRCYADWDHIWHSICWPITRYDARGNEIGGRHEH